MLVSICPMLSLCTGLPRFEEVSSWRRICLNTGGLWGGGGQGGRPAFWKNAETAATGCPLLLRCSHPFLCCSEQGQGRRLIYACAFIYSSFIHSHPVSVYCLHYKSYVSPHSFLRKRPKNTDCCKAVNTVAVAAWCLHPPRASWRGCRKSSLWQAEGWDHLDLHRHPPHAACTAHPQQREQKREEGWEKAGVYRETSGWHFPCTLSWAGQAGPGHQLPEAFWREWAKSELVCRESLKPPERWLQMPRPKEEKQICEGEMEPRTGNPVRQGIRAKVGQEQMQWVLEGPGGKSRFVFTDCPKWVGGPGVLARQGVGRTGLSRCILQLPDRTNENLYIDLCAGLGGNHCFNRVSKPSDMSKAILGGGVIDSDALLDKISN